MNREIKFRAWSEHQYKMINFNDLVNQEWNFQDIDRINCGGSFCKLMQYTGRKDKNGKEIYEGDIIEKHFEKYEVLFHNCEWVFTKLNDYYKEYFYKLNFFDNENFEIVGNIFENPEFIKSSE